MEAPSPMSLETDLKRLPLEELASKLHGDQIPLNSRFSYFFAALPPNEEDVQEYLRDPVAALPPSLVEALPPVWIVMVPYLERVTHDGGNGDKGEDFAVFEEPAADRRIWASKLARKGETVLFFALKDQDVAEYHYGFYRLMAELALDHSQPGAKDEYEGILRDELKSAVHGEVDTGSWQLKQSLLRRQRNMHRKTKGFSAYARQSLLDTLTLYLHGICCDIDVETGPRQIASRHLRRRLELIQSVYPPPEGFAVFPEDLNHVGESKK